MPCRYVCVHLQIDVGALRSVPQGRKPDELVRNVILGSVMASPLKSLMSEKNFRYQCRYNNLYIELDVVWKYINLMTIGEIIKFIEYQIYPLFVDLTVCKKFTS